MSLFKWFKNDREQRLIEREKELERKIRNLEADRDTYRDRLAEAKGDLRDVQQKRDAEERDIQHLLKLEREREEVSREKFEAKCERERDQAIAEVKDEYRDRLENELRQQLERVEKMNTEVLNRLPNISASLEGKIGSR